MRDTFLGFTLLYSLHVVYSLPSVHADFRVCQEKNGNFPKPGSSCRSYYKCKNWMVVEAVCPEDQHFFPAGGYCVWPEEYPCLEKPKAKECPLPDGNFLKKGTKCKVYYQCRKGNVVTEKKCHGELLFDQERGNCDWPEFVACPEEPKSKDCSHLNGKFLRPGTGCKIFFDCHNGVATEKVCPEDQLFDPSTQKCEWPEIYTCVEDRTTIETTISQTTPVITTSTFIGTITKENVITTTVPTVSSTKGSTIDSDKDSSEEGKSSEESNRLSTTKRPITDSDEDNSEGNSSEENNKNMFTTLRISKSTSSIESKTKLTTVTVFEKVSSKKGGSTDDCIVDKITYKVKSDKPSSPTEPLDNKDSDSTTVVSEMTDSVTLNIFCPEPNGYFPHPNNRHKFVACVSGIPTIMDCPANLVYDHKRRSCEYEKTRI